jgi:hypothetical protein
MARRVRVEPGFLRGEGADQAPLSAEVVSGSLARVMHSLYEQPRPPWRDDELEAWRQVARGLEALLSRGDGLTYAAVGKDLRDSFLQAQGLPATQEGVTLPEVVRWETLARHAHWLYEAEGREDGLADQESLWPDYYRRRVAVLGG